MWDPVTVPSFELEGGLLLRPLRPSDADALLAYLSDPAVTERTSYPAPTPALAERIIARSLQRWQAGELSKWGLALKSDDRLVGTCGFTEHAREHRWAELAYDLARPVWGKRRMSAAVEAALGFAFAHGEIDRVQACVRVDNARSVTLLERHGFQREGCLRSYRICRGRAHDFFVYGLLREDLAGR